MHLLPIRSKLTIQSTGVHPVEDQDPDLLVVHAPWSLCARQWPFKFPLPDLAFVEVVVSNKAKLTCYFKTVLFRFVSRTQLITIEH